MRPDMAQVIIERPRGGMRYKTPKGSRRRLQRGLDVGPSREGIKRTWGLRLRREYGGPLYSVAVRRLSKAELRSLPVPRD